MPANALPEWQFDETHHKGVDYSSIEEVSAYDGVHRRFRNYEKDTEIILRRLNLGPASVVIDMGTGTGAFALHAAPRCREIHAVDVSRTMLDYTQREAKRIGLENIRFHHAGLLTYEHQAESADALVCVAVLHHLPDFWKQVALSRCARMLKPAGRLYLFDIVFPSAAEQLPKRIDQWVQWISSQVDARLGHEAVVHVRDEFSTYDWIMEGMLQRSGFQIEVAEYADGFQATYVCSKP